MCVCVWGDVKDIKTKANNPFMVNKTLYTWQPIPSCLVQPPKNQDHCLHFKSSSTVYPNEPSYRLPSCSYHSSIYYDSRQSYQRQPKELMTHPTDSFWPRFWPVPNTSRINTAWPVVGWVRWRSIVQKRSTVWNVAFWVYYVMIFGWRQIIWEKSWWK